MKFSLTTRVYIGFIVLVLLSATIGVTDHIALTKQEQISTALNHIYQVINVTENVRNLLTDMETGRRGYRCTNQKKYLEPYYLAMDQIGPSLSQIRELVTGDSEQINNINLLAKSINSTLLFWSKLRVDESKYDTTEIIKITSEEKNRMDEIRAIAKIMLEKEHKKQKLAEAANNKLLAYTSWSAPVGSILEQVFILTIVKEKQLNELKSRFVSMASHEFRTPLAAILASTYLAAKYQTKEDQPKREKHFERITSSVHNLTEILEDLLSVEKLEAGKIAVRLQIVDLEEYINSLISDFDTVLKPGQVIVYEHKGTTSVTLDPSFLKRIMTNLISNAIKFSKENTTILVSSCHNGTQLTISVKDTGIGIPKEDMEHLFGRFHRGNNVAAIGGTGLGLHIVSKYTNLMQGAIQCISEEGIGTEFILTFQQIPAATTTAAV
jgi:signal transduction histidine kinase